jgi:(2S)-methylsuccinyl-CoA dehydrogenase
LTLSFDDLDEATAAAAGYLARVRQRVTETMAVLGPEQAFREQRRLHGLAWVATLVEGLDATAGWARRAADAGRFTDGERRLVEVAFSEHLSQLTSAVPMGQGELLRPQDLDATDASADLAANPAVRALIAKGGAKARAAVVDQLISGWRPDDGLDDEVLDAVRRQIRAFTRDQIAPHAQAWHLRDALLPDAVLARMADLGVFGVCVPTEHGGLGLGKLAMCVVSEELSRGWIAAGSIGTRAEIAGELIATAGTPEQKAHWLPLIASGQVLPAAVFTEPNAGSDLASVATRATFDGTHWRVSGSKLWITHASRSDLFTILARTSTDAKGFGGLSILLAAKTRGDEAEPFPDAGLFGSPIDVLGYRGMREYALSFDDFAVAPEGLLGGREGEGFRQLMRTFESARIQTAARALGVARAAFELGLQHAQDRRQFGRPIIEFPRIGDKLVLALAEILAARELTYSAARAKDRSERCDREAGMAKLLASRVAWSAADGALQIHGGNGYALESEMSRVFCDARVLGIFEGTSEVQANVIARSLVEAGRNN